MLIYKNKSVCSRLYAICFHDVPEWNYERVMMEKPDENCINNLNIILIEGLASALCRPTAKGMTVVGYSW